MFGGAVLARCHGLLRPYGNFRSFLVEKSVACFSLRRTGIFYRYARFLMRLAIPYVPLYLDIRAHLDDACLHIFNRLRAWQQYMAYFLNRRTLAGAGNFLFRLVEGCAYAQRRNLNFTRRIPARFLELV